MSAAHPSQPPQMLRLRPAPSRDADPRNLPGHVKGAAIIGAIKWLRNRRFIGIYFALAVLVWFVFGRTVDHQFIDYDDQNYVYANTRITEGVTRAGLVSAFTQPHAENWHPITTISHMLDCQVFGLDPAGHHLVNVLLHATAALLLFSVLHAMTGAVWRSAFVAAVFAIHPLRAESVAWIAERKDVLSGVFLMLTLAAYLRYVRNQRLGNYLVTIACFVCGLMSKPTMVTVPLLLLLLDYWPLGRFDHQPAGASDENGTPGPRIVRPHSRVWIEKIPLLLTSLAAAIVTVAVQRQTVGYGQSLSLIGRLSNALVSYVAYIGQMIWPMNLAVFYPDRSDHLSLITVSGAALLLAGLTCAVWWLRRTRPYLLAGWGWYLIALLPVIGIVQVGLQSRADRYTYLPQIGLYIAVSWGLASLSQSRLPVWRPLVAVGAAGIVILLAWRAAIQTEFWKDTESLWTHALAVTENNDVAHNNLAALLMQRGRYDDAIIHYQAALTAGSHKETHNHLSPAIVENSLGNAFAQKNELDSAIIHYQHAVEMRPDFADARSNLAAMLVRKGDLMGAISEYESVVATPPEDASCHERLAAILIRAGRMAEAIAHYRRALALAPNSLESMNALAWIDATRPDRGVRNVAEALTLAQRADRLTGGKDPVVLRIVAATYAAAGRLAEAVATDERAMTFAGDAGLRHVLDGELHRYRAAESSAKQH